MSQRRIGFFSGSFNPVHAGHIAFALQALQAAKLDAVYFLPERRPRHKQGAEHFAHRVAMLKTAVRPHAQLHVLELDDISFTVKRTLPRLQQRFADTKLYFLIGSDVVPHLAQWPYVGQLMKSSELIIGLRNGDDRARIEAGLRILQPATAAGRFLASHAPNVSSRLVREALRARRYTPGLLRSVAQYSNRHWLYISLAQN